MRRTDQSDEQGEERSSRRPYERPMVVDSAQFETLAMACGKLEGDVECEITGPAKFS